MTRRPKTKGLRNLTEVTLSETRWKEKASCKDKDTNLFFATPKSDESIIATAICKSCPVRAECFYEALQFGYDGIWGGSNADQRTAIIGVMLDYNLSNLTKELSDSLIHLVDEIGKTKNSALADLINYKSTITDDYV
jgi:WhiB family redox-sensing transcriptional regulator